MPVPTRETPGRETPQPRSVLTGPPISWSGRRPELRVQVEAALNSNRFIQPPDVVDWSNVTLGLNDSEATATIIVRGLDANRLARANPTGNDLLGDQHFTHLLEMLSPNKRVQIGTGFNTGDPLILFQGYPLQRSVRWSGNGQSLTVTCISEADEYLAVHPLQIITGQVRRLRPDVAYDASAPDTTILDALPLVFNPGGKPNMNPWPYGIEIEGKTHLIHFPCDPNDPAVKEDHGLSAAAKHWNYANALRYLCAYHVAIGGSPVSVSDFLQDTDAEEIINVAPQQTGDPFVDLLTARVTDVSCANMSVREALVLLCGEAGLHFQTMIARGKGTTGIGPRYVLRVFAALADGQEEQSTPSGRHMIMPKVRDLPHQAPFTDQTGVETKDFSLANKAAFECDLTLDARVVNEPILPGGVRTYECTLLLRPGWAPQANLDNLVNASQAQKDAAIGFWEGQLEGENEFGGSAIPTSIYHGQHPGHLSVSDVARLWIFPDSMRYIGQGLERQGWDARLYSPFMPEPGVGLVFGHDTLGGAIEDSDNWVIRPRPFRDTIGRTSKDARRSPAVQIAFDFAFNGDATAGYSATWRDYAGDVSIDTERAALRLTPANFLQDAQLREDPSDSTSQSMVEAIINGTFAVRVACCIEGDSRIVGRSFAGTNERPRAGIKDVSGRFKHLRRRGQNSHISTFVHAPDEAEFEGREDDLALADYAAKMRRRSGKETAAASVVVPWCDADGGWELGDAITGCSGIDIPFAGYSEIVSKSYSNNGGHVQTTYNVGDLRHSPEIA